MKSTLRNLINARIPELSRTRKTSWGEEHTEYLPIQWSDYLRCLGPYFAIDGDGYIMRVSEQGWGSIDVKVDLTKPVLEQTDEILQKLVDLISKE